MKRIFQSIAGGILIPILLLAAACIFQLYRESCCFEISETDWAVLLMGEYLETDLLSFPVDMLGPLFPDFDSLDPNASTIRWLLYLTAFLIDILVYSALSYALLWIGAKRKRLA